MAEVRNCPSCGGIFYYTGIRDVCPLCVMAEEEMYNKVYEFLRRRENRTASAEQIVKETGVSTKLLYKWVRKGHLHPSKFPNLGYPCDSCGLLITIGKICEKCTNSLKKDLDIVEAEEDTIVMNETYLAHGKYTNEIKFDS
ncbi:TIGR03826 family flagellar region protein [Sporosarcina sp. FSL W8-0480]|uniref:TIGR03826 family flagellar region protein n=1 Tax=Sporosarcina sp. FSL W8-0480 TaxID=2954701 RepID=UPI0030D78E77